MFTARKLAALFIKAPLVDCALVDVEPDVVALVTVADTLAVTRVRLYIPPTRLFVPYNLFDSRTLLPIHVPTDESLECRARRLVSKCLLVSLVIHPDAKQVQQTRIKLLLVLFTAENLPRYVRVTCRLLVRPNHPETTAAIDTRVNHLGPIHPAIGLRKCL